MPTLEEVSVAATGNSRSSVSQTNTLHTCPFRIVEPFRIDGDDNDVIFDTSRLDYSLDSEPIQRKEGALHHVVATRQFLAAAAEQVGALEVQLFTHHPTATV